MVKHEFDIIPTLGFVVGFFFSFQILKPVKIYWAFVGFVITFLCIAIQQEWMAFHLNLILLNYCFLILFIHYIQHITFLNTQDKFRFTNEIVNKGNSITIAANKKGEVSFCSESVEEILGYTPEEMLGFGFWILTEDPDFIGEDYGDGLLSFTLPDGRIVSKEVFIDGNFENMKYLMLSPEDDDNNYLTTYTLSPKE